MLTVKGNGSQLSHSHGRGALLTDMYYTTEMTNKQEENLQERNSKKNKVNKRKQESEINEHNTLDDNNKIISRKIIDKQIGIRLQNRRKQLYISQTELGKALGLTFQQIQKYERGANRLSCSRMFQISKILQISTGYFFNGLVTEQKPKGNQDCNHNQEMPVFNTIEEEKDNTIENEIQDSIINIAVDLEKDPILRKIRNLEKEVWKIRAEEKAGSSYK